MILFYDALFSSCKWNISDYPQTNTMNYYHKLNLELCILPNNVNNNNNNNNNQHINNEKNTLQQNYKLQSFLPCSDYFY